MGLGKLVKYKSTMDSKQNKEIKKLKKEVKSLVKRDELKFKDATVAGQAISANIIAPYQFDLCAMPVWSTNVINANELRNSSREGNKVVVKRAHIKGTISLANDQGSVLDPTYDTKVRMIIVLNPDSGYPLLDQVLEDPNNIFSPLKCKPSEPYRKLYDRTFDLQRTEQTHTNAAYYSSTSVEPWRHNFNIKLGKKAFGKEGLKCTWQQGSSTIHPQQGAVTMFVMSTVGLATSFKPSLDFYSRLRFSD